MAERSAVWGIDIGQAGLKAIRLRYAEASEQVIAVAFDYVPHPKILSQPDAVPDELVRQALQTFLSRNDTKGDLLAISVPGQTALARFIQLPPVESSKVGEIVKYEARQQIPFALEDVIWDYQTLGSGIEEGGYLLDAEVGLFAMKREQVQQHLRPFTEARCEVELIQIAPLALYNFLCYDRMGIRLDSDPSDSNEHTIVLDMGADNTTLLVSNGQKIWIRNVPIGGNHFTRALTKEMKLTFAKAEHLKCNATKSPDPKAVFQALRPVFNDYVSEIQRSIGYFSSVNRDAKIKEILGVGNGFKLAGLQKFLHQNLQYEVERVETFDALAGDAVLNTPLFQENILTFTVPYGLALQGLKLTRIHTSLLPQEIKTARMIRRKKPLAVAASGLLLVGLATSAFGMAMATSTVSEERWKDAQQKADQVASQASSLKSSYDQAEGRNKELREKGNFLVAPADGQMHWAEVYKAINESLPRDVGEQLDTTDIRKKNRISLHQITVKRHTDLSQWFNTLRSAQFMLAEDKANPPTGPGYVFTLTGRHYHDEKNKENVLYVRDTLLKNLQQWTVNNVPVGQLGISHAAITSSSVAMIDYYPFGKPTQQAGMDPAAAPMVGGFVNNRPRPMAVAPGANEVVNERKPIVIPETNFTIEFVWRETPASERLPTRPTAEGAGGEGAAVDPAAGAPPADPGMP